MINHQTGPRIAVPAPRIEYLDLLRGIAVLGILWMNAVDFGLSDVAYYRLDWAGWSWGADQLVALLGRVLFDQKMMGLFSLLFGASIVLFIERVSVWRTHPVRLSLWRNMLLLMMGLVHAYFWDGDVLTIYALCAPLVLMMHELPVRVLYAVGGALFLSTACWAIVLQAYISATDTSALGWFWVRENASGSTGLEAWFIFDAYARALAMMLVGVGMYRTGILTGTRSAAWYKRCTVIGFGVGVPLAAANLIVQVATDFSAHIALVSFAFNTLATIPITLGIVGAVMWWAHPGRRSSSVAVRQRLQAVGRMALTNYLTQTMLGLLILGTVAELVDLHRTYIALYVIAVWALQLWWSPRWLARHTMGPVEWVWRMATYRRWQPLRRDATGEVAVS